jgi:hypothetical protein
VLGTWAGILAKAVEQTGVRGGNATSYPVVPDMTADAAFKVSRRIYSEELEKLRASAYRASVEQILKVSFPVLEELANWQVLLEEEIVLKLRSELAQGARYISAEIKKAGVSNSAGFWSSLFGLSVSSQQIMAERKELDAQTERAEAKLNELKSECLEVSLYVQAAIEELLASLGADDLVNLQDPNLRALCEFRKEKLLCQFLSGKCVEADRLIERTKLATEELLQQCEESKHDNRIVAAEISLMNLGAQFNNEERTTQRFESRNPGTPVTKAFREINSLVENEQRAAQSVEEESAALREELNELGKELERFSVGLGHGEASEAGGTASFSASSRSLWTDLS